MIDVTCRNGEHFSIDPAAIERVDLDPDTVVHLVDGTKYVVAESFDALLTTILSHRARAVVAHKHLTDPLPKEPPPFRVERRQFRRDLSDPGAWPRTPPGRDDA